MKKNKKENTVKNNLPSDLDDIWIGSHEGISIQDRYNIQRTLDALHLEGEEREKAEKELTELVMSGIVMFEEIELMRAKNQLDKALKQALVEKQANAENQTKQANAEKQTKEDEEELTM